MKRLLPLILLFAVCACGTGPRQHGVSETFEVALNGSGETNRYAMKPADAPDDGCTRLRIKGIGGTLGKVFSDLNAAHLSYAVPQGIKPVEDLASAWRNGTGLVRVESDSCVYIDSLTHSYPYLTHTAAALLHEIGGRFRDSLAARGGGDYRIKVTSMLRTDGSVAKLRRVNRNASGESAHVYATTFDISHSKFICDNPAGVRRTFEDLKNLLAEIVNDLRNEGRCLVKHERRQACLHITAIAKEESDNEEASQ